MNICPNCEASAKKLVDTFTRLERIHLLAAATSMARSVHDRDVQDKRVSSSVVTKLLLSFDPQTREVLLQQFRQAVGMDIVLDSCAHGKLSVVT